VDGAEIKRIREKLGMTREEFASFLCLSGYRSLMNIETDFRKPSKLAIRLLRYIDGQQKRKVVPFVEEFKGYEPK
jgi:DNA-binding transcriptional regulator YiaG